MSVPEEKKPPSNPAPPDAKKSPPPPRTKSGEQPAIRAYRQKLDSIDEGTFDAVKSLDSELKDFLDSIRPDPPEAPIDEEGKDE